MKAYVCVLALASCLVPLATIAACSGVDSSPVDSAAVDGASAPQPSASGITLDGSAAIPPDEPRDNPALYGRPSTCGSDAGAAPAPADAGTDAGRRFTCYEEADVETLRGRAPIRGQNVCTAAAIEAIRVACVGNPSSPSAPRCQTVLDANRDCARCVFGALDGESPALVRAPALLSLADGTAIVNQLACAAIVVGRPDCALPLSKQVTCTRSACSLCGTSESSACLEEAACGACANGDYSPECTAAVAETSAWAGACRGRSFDESYTKVATFFCGAR